MEEHTQVEKCVIDYIGNNTHADLNKINSQTMLFKEGIFDSMGFVLLIDFLEEQFGIVTDDSELIEENFESVKAITNYILRKQALNAA